jgi:hypothetical protein
VILIGLVALLFGWIRPSDTVDTKLGHSTVHDTELQNQHINYNPYGAHGRYGNAHEVY